MDSRVVWGQFLLPSPPLHGGRGISHQLYAGDGAMHQKDYTGLSAIGDAGTNLALYHFEEGFWIYCEPQVCGRGFSRHISIRNQKRALTPEGSFAIVTDVTETLSGS